MSQEEDISDAKYIEGRASDAEADGQPDESTNDSKAVGLEQPGGVVTTENTSPNGPAPREESGLDTRWIGYLGGILVIALSVVFTTGERNMFGRQAPAAETKSVSGPCDEWKEKLCEGVGSERAESCSQATAAVQLLTDDACRLQLRALPSTIAKIQSARADCATLMDKLCTEIGEQSASCSMVRSRTPSFPAQRCTEMLQRYDEVASELRDRVEKATAPHPRGMPGAMHSRPEAQRAPKPTSQQTPGHGPSMPQVSGKIPVPVSPAAVRNPPTNP